MERTKHLSYRKLLKKLDERFGDRELPASAQVRFQQATQKKDESLEDWADRLLTLSGKAFKDLPEKYSNQQAVARFCQGLRDAEAGHHVCMKKSLSIEDAVNEIRLYQRTKDAIYGHKTDRNVSSRVTSMPIHVLQYVIYARKRSCTHLSFGTYVQKRRVIFVHA